MAVCVPCECPEMWIGDELTFRKGLLKAVCSIAGGGGGGDVNLVSVSGTPITLGQKIMAASLPVTIASDQSNLPVNVAQFGGVNVTIGQQLSAASIPVVISSNQSNLPTNIAQFGGTNVTIGQQLSAASVPVVISSDFVATRFGVYAEDSIHVSGDFGVQALGVANPLLNAATSAPGDYSFLSVGNRGNLLNTPVFDSDLANGLSPIRREDTAFAAADSVMMIGAVNVRNRTAFNSTQGDVTPLGVDDYGGLIPGTFAMGTAVEGSLATPTTTYQTLITNAAIRQHISVYNGSDRVIALSSDGTNAFAFVGAGATETIYLAQSGLHAVTNISCKAMVSNSTTGTVYGAMPRMP